MGWRHYWPIARRLRDTGLACLGAGQNVADGGSTLMPPRTLGCHGLVFVTEGSGVMADLAGDPATGRLVEFAAPALLWLFPGVAHRYGPGPTGWAESWILFDGVAAAGYADYGVADPHRPLVIVPRPLDRTVDDAFAFLHGAAQRPGRSGQVIAAGAVHFLIGLATAQQQGSDPVARSLVDRLAESSAESMTIAQRARNLGVTAAELRDHAMRETGLTPHEVILRVRLARAQHLLTSSDLTVSQIAAQVGYDDAGYFSRFFRRRVGMAPQEFRQLP